MAENKQQGWEPRGAASPTAEQHGGPMTPAQPASTPAGQSNRTTEGYLGMFPAIIVSCGIFIFLVLYLVFAPVKQKITKKNADVCESAGCAEHAYYLNKSLLRSVHPCDNFYQFVCGSWAPPRKGLSSVASVMDHTVANAIRATADKHPAMSRSRASRKAYDMYDSCVAARFHSVSNAAIMKQFMADHNMTLEESNADSLEVLVDLSVNWYLDFLFQLTVHRPSGTARRLLLVYPGSMVDFFMMADADDEEMENFMQHHIRLFDFDSVPTDLHIFFLVRSNVSKIVSQLTEASVVGEATWKRFRFSDVQGHMPFINASTWLNMLNRQFSALNIEFTAMDEVLFTDARLVHVLNSLYGTGSLVQSQDLLRFVSWKFVVTFGWMFDTTISDIAFAYTVNVTAMVSLACCMFVERTYGFAMTARYLLEKVDDDARTQVDDFLNTIQSSLLRLIDESTWIDEPSRTALKEKLAALTRWIWLRGRTDYNTRLDTLYNAFPIVDDDIVATHWILSNRELAQRLHSPDYLEYAVTTDPTRYRYLYHLNAVFLPMSLLFSPMYFEDGIPAMNYAGLGAVFAQTLTLLYDEVGIEFNAANQFVPSATNETIERYRARLSCHEQDGDTDRLGIWERAAFEVALAAYKDENERSAANRRRLVGLEEFSSDAIFYMSYCYAACTRHKAYFYPLRRTRVCNAVRHFEHFASTFGCEASQLHEEAKKCPSFW